MAPEQNWNFEVNGLRLSARSVDGETPVITDGTVINLPTFMEGLSEDQMSEIDAAAETMRSEFLSWPDAARENSPDWDEA